MKNDANQTGASTCSEEPVVAADTRMDAELKTKWVAALRSGEYEQCRGKLHDGLGYCCLGVFGVVIGIPRADLILRSAFTGAAGNNAPELMRLAEIKPAYEKTTLVSMNDSGKTFPEIADYIEANL